MTSTQYLQAAQATLEKIKSEEKVTSETHAIIIKEEGELEIELKRIKEKLKELKTRKEKLLSTHQDSRYINMAHFEAYKGEYARLYQHEMAVKAQEDIQQTFSKLKIEN